MDVLTNLIKSEIKRQYKSVRNFSAASEIPYSTLANSLSKGVGLTSYDTVKKIMVLLGINPILEKNNLNFYNERYHVINEMLSKLDEKGMHTIETILNVEYARCCPDQPMVASTNKTSYAENKEEIERKKNEYFSR